MPIISPERNSLARFYASSGKRLASGAVRTGGPYLLFGGGPIWNQGQGSDQRPSVRRNNPSDFARELPPYRWLELLACSRFLYANTPALRGLYADRATYVAGAGWRPVYRGRNKAWGKLAKKWLVNWFKGCDVRGFPYTFGTHLRAASLALDRDGDYGVQKVRGPDGYPQLQFHPAHRINTRFGHPIVETGPYAGMWCICGVIINEVSRPVAYNILGQTPLDDIQVPAEDMRLNYTPDFMDQFRGTPNAAQAIDAWADLATFEEYERMAALVGSSQTLIESNETGQNEERSALTKSRSSTQPGTGPQQDARQNIQVESFAKGTVRYILGRGRGKLEMFEHNRPSPNTLAFVEKIERGIGVGSEWPYEFWRDPSKLTSAGIHAVFGKAQRSVENRQGIIAPVADWMRNFALGAAMDVPGGLGLLPFDEDWMEWAWQLPRPVGSDDSRNTTAQIDEIKMGVRSVRRHIEEDDRDYDDHISQIEAEADDRFTRAEELHKKHPEFTLQQCLDQVQQRNPNGSAAGAPKPEPTEDDGEPEEKPGKKPLAFEVNRFTERT